MAVQDLLTSAAWKAEQRARNAERRGRREEAAFFAGQAEGLRAAAYLLNLVSRRDASVVASRMPADDPSAGRPVKSPTAPVPHGGPDAG
jgi:hypothetical protein